MNLNDSYNGDSPRNDGGNDRGGDRTSDLVREILRRNRENNSPERPNATPSRPRVEENRPANASANGDDVSDAVSQVLRRLRGGTSESAAPARVSTPLVERSRPMPPGLPRAAAPPRLDAQESAPPEYSLQAPSVLASTQEDAARDKFSDKKKKNKSKKSKRSRRVVETEAAAAALGTFSAAPVVADAEDPNAFLASVALNERPVEQVEPALDGLVAENAEAADSDEFLERLEQDADLSESEEGTAADAKELLSEQSAKEKAAKNAPMWLTSLFFHMILLIILALIFSETRLKKAFEVISEPGFSDEVVIDEVFDPDANFTVDDTSNVDAEAVEVESDVVDDVPDVSAFNEETAEALSIVETDMGTEGALAGDVENLMGSLNGDDLSGRGQNKAAMLVTGGGSEGSEKSVALALAWIAEHQLPDGSWSFQMGRCPSCGGQCRNSGAKDSPIAATSMALLPFLAAGNTPTQGKYKKVVAKGMNFLTSVGKETENGLDLRESEGNMYSHGLAAITLCEAFAMMSGRERSRYRQLGYQAQATLAFIEYAQAADGGWRYTPKQAGDTSVSGWQLMALKSGELAGFDISDTVVLGARNFLRDIVSLDYESRYSYMAGQSESNATDSIGLLCRLYLDWGIDNESLLKGVSRLSDVGPHLNAPYYTYYATQLMYNVGGDIWSKWNARVRDNLIKTQEMDGHERGSWFPNDPDGHCVTGGRLYATSLNCMVLEVYYRHMPLYQKMERNTNFPLETPAQ